MLYQSTRGQAPDLGFEDVLLTGLARDGGLYVPKQLPTFGADEIAAMSGLSYVDTAVKVMAPFVAPDIDEADLREMVEDAYAQFDHAAVTPLSQFGSNEWLLELYHGPTLAFKDVALQLLGRLFDHSLTKRGEQVTIVGATSGDTGSAAIEGVRDRECARIFMLHPKGKVSEVQRRQMTTILSDNVYNIAVEGTFDDCQNMVKAMFNDLPFRDAMKLSAVNSINWARVMAQIVYYFYAGVALGAPYRKLAFSVPTGNFGDIYAGFMASRMGLPVEQLVIATNMNDILTRAFETNEYKLGQVYHTISPSMDIQISSNFERFLFNVYGEDGAMLKSVMDEFAANGQVAIDAARLDVAKQMFSAHRINEEETMGLVREFYGDTGRLIDTHTAIGIGAARARWQNTSTPMVTLSTAHPAKFPDAVEKATGVHPALPKHLHDLYEREEKYTVLPNDLSAIQDYIRDQS
ncbi:MAG: threonine synthase [Kordiimonas sp.]|nr:threonine synthase [Kordiimonas sp.]